MAKNTKVVRPAAFRRPVQSLAVEGARLPPPIGQKCDVDVSRCVGLDENGFGIIDGEAGREFFFCQRHALAAEALVTFGGFRGSVVPHLLMLIDRGELDGPAPSVDEVTARALEPKK